MKLDHPSSAAHLDLGHVRPLPPECLKAAVILLRQIDKGRYREPSNPNIASKRHALDVCPFSLRKLDNKPI
jgi:hypothetical protein